MFALPVVRLRYIPAKGQPKRETNKTNKQKTAVVAKHACERGLTSRSAAVRVLARSVNGDHNKVHAQFAHARANGSFSRCLKG